MDINNEMILMRKDIKKAKIHVVSKLVRRIRLLKNKKGSDVQRQKHANHAQNLLNEIAVIKERKADSIFKYLLSSNLTIEDVNRQSNLSLWDRACVRIGAVPFIHHKMTVIRDRVDQFDTLRSDKATSTSLKLVNKMVTAEVNKKGGVDHDHGGENKHPRLLEDENPICKKRRDDCDIIQPKSDDQLSDFKNTRYDHDLSGADSDVTSPVERQPSQSMVATALEPVRDPDSYATSIEVVLPDFYTRSNESSKPDVKQKTAFDFSLSKSDDVSEVLSNIGTGFFDSGDDITDNEVKDVTEEEKDGADDGFFVSSGATKSASERQTHTNEPALRANVTSTFISSLSDVKVETPYRTKTDEPFCMGKKKNRLGQRRRKQKQHAMGHGVCDAKTSAASVKETKKSKAAKQNAPLHPSWVASQQRKEQSIIKEYSGTRIKFDDSD